MRHTGVSIQRKARNDEHAICAQCNKRLRLDTVEVFCKHRIKIVPKRLLILLSTIVRYTDKDTQTR